MPSPRAALEDEPLVRPERQLFSPAERDDILPSHRKEAAVLAQEDTDVLAVVDDPQHTGHDDAKREHSDARYATDVQRIKKGESLRSVSYLPRVMPGVTWAVTGPIWTVGLLLSGDVRAVEALTSAVWEGYQLRIDFHQPLAGPCTGVGRTSGVGIPGCHPLAEPYTGLRELERDLGSKLPTRAGLLRGAGWGPIHPGLTSTHPWLRSNAGLVGSNAVGRRPLHARVRADPNRIKARHRLTSG